MTIQPKYHWQFNEREGTVTKDMNGVEAKLVGCSLQLHGRIGNAIQVNGKNGALYLGKEAGQFGIGNFTIAFGIVVLSRHDDNNLDIIGTRSSKSHGNWVSLLLINKNQLYFEVDEDSNGTNYFSLQSENVLNDHSWHHIALVREGLTLRIYVDGVLQAEGEAPGIANIHNDSDMKVGDWLRDTPTARYEDLRIYDKALSEADIQSLIPPLQPILRPGQIELVAFDQAAIILSEDDTDLTRYSTEFQKLRLGSNTGVTLYRAGNFEGVSQKLYADIPEIRFTKVDAFPKSIQIWSAIDSPFTGKWIISAGNKRYLNQNKNMLEVPKEQPLSNPLFSFLYNPDSHQTLLVPANNVEMPLLKVGNDNASILVVDDSEIEQAAFSIVHSSGHQWLKLDGNLKWTDEREQRTLFYRVMKIADSEEQVGEIAEGEVAFYQHGSYHGKAWVLSDYEPGVTGNFMTLKDFAGLDNTISSIRVGPNTGVTLFANEQQRVDAGKEETQQEDILNNIPDMGTTQLKHDNVSSLKIFRTVAPETIFTSVTSKLSQDYRLVDDQLVEFSSYQTILRLNPEVTEVQVSATDLTTIEFEDTLYEIDEVNSVTLRANLLHQIMISSEASGLSTPGLKFRTESMPENQFVAISPDEPVHRQIANLEAGTLLNAKDEQGNLIIDQSKHPAEKIKTVENTIKRTMGAVLTKEDNTVPDSGVLSSSGLSRVVSTTQVVSGATIENPWALDFSVRTDVTDGLARGTGEPEWEEALTWEQYEELRVQAVSIQSRGAKLSIRNAIKNAVRVVIGTASDVLNIIIDGVEFLLDTVSKVVEFVEAVIEKIFESVQDFIEFLRFVFNWDDIKDTRRYLAETIDLALGSVNDMVEAAQESVGDFVNTLQADVEEGINSVIASLGVEPSEVRQGAGLPDDIEWLLHKILGGIKRQAQPDLNPSGSNLNEIIQQALDELIDAIDDLVGTGTRTFEGLVDTVESLIVNPNQPLLALVEILETFRDVIIQGLDVGEKLISAFLKALVAAFELLREFLNTRFRLPLIEKLLEDDLTVLNVATLLVAVPLTAIVKAFTGKAPFKNLPQPGFPGRENDQSGSNDRIIRKMNGFGYLAILADLINNQINFALDLAPEISDDEGQGTFILEGISLVLSGLSWLGSFPASPEEPGGYPYNIFLDKHKPGSLKSIREIEDSIIRNQKELLFWQQLLWGYRTGILGIEMLLFAVSKFVPALPKQRLRRGNEVTSVLFTLATAGDLAISGYSFTLIPREDETRRLHIANEVFSLAPGLFGWLRFPRNPKVLAVTIPTLGAINVSSMLTTYFLSIELLEANVNKQRERQ